MDITHRSRVIRGRLDQRKGNLGKSGKKPSGSDVETFNVLWSAAEPVLTAKLIVDELPITHRSLHERLFSLDEQGVLDRIDVDPTGGVWWIVEDSRREDQDYETLCGFLS